MRSLTVGQVSGIDLRIHPTFALVLLWVIYQWGGLHAGVGRILFGLVLVGLVFACVVLHELGHAMMAQHYGVRVHHITLLPTGGVALVEQVPMSPRAELLMALAGPAVNVAIAAALLPPVALLAAVHGLTIYGDYLGGPTITAPGGLLLYLFASNLFLVVFNLLPAFPMDGGRVFRAVLAHYLGRERATRVAVSVGQLLALGMAVFGVWIGDYLLPLVAALVIVAAYGEGRAVRVESALRRLRVGQFVLWDMGGIAPSQPLTLALRGGPRDLAVTENGKVVGMLWRHQLLQALNGGASGRRVEDVMELDVVTADVNDSVFDVQQLMHHVNRWAVPVIESGQYRGIVTADRIAHMYRHLTPSPRRRRAVAGFASTVGDLVRAWIR